MFSFALCGSYGNIVVLVYRSILGLELECENYVLLVFIKTRYTSFTFFVLFGEKIVKAKISLYSMKGRKSFKMHSH